MSVSAAQAIRNTLSQFVSGVAGGRAIDAKALTQSSIDDLHAAVIAELKATSLRDHLDLLNSKNQIMLSCYVAADFLWSHPFEHRVIVALLTIFFFHAEDILEESPDLIRSLQLKLATGQSTGDPMLDWFSRELIPRLYKHFDPLIVNMIVVACYDFINGIGIELLTKNVELDPEARNFPTWLRFKTGLSPMYALLGLASPSDKALPTGGVEKYVQSIPDIITFTNIVNDVISFYKELAAGEKENYVLMKAQTERIDMLTALQSMAEEGIHLYDRVMNNLKEAPEYRANFEAYAKGITQFHTSAPRYRMKELFTAIISPAGQIPLHELDAFFTHGLGDLSILTLKHGPWHRETSHCLAGLIPWSQSPRVTVRPPFSLVWSGVDHHIAAELHLFPIEASLAGPDMQRPTAIQARGPGLLDHGVHGPLVQLQAWERRVPVDRVCLAHGEEASRLQETTGFFDGFY
ncbi:Alpha-cuprenene synthase COP6 [Paramyrothecium foliicola]|nr:Alpha-cuprenene synthase COP6 [Paramyrothecium foliicola]